MRKLAVILMFMLLAAGFWVEQRAINCGFGIVQPTLPPGLRANWETATFWLTDADGWGVISPPGDLKLSNGTVLKTKRIEGYTPERGFIVAIIRADGGIALVTFRNAMQPSLRPDLVATNEPEKLLDTLKDDPSWRPLDPGTCLYGAFGWVRILFAACFIWLGVVVWRLRPSIR